MISNCFSLFLFFYLFTVTIGKNYVKILQIYEQTNNLCDNRKCDINQQLNVINFVKEKQPNIIFWFCKFETNKTIFNKFNNNFTSKSIVVPIYGDDKSQYSYYNLSKIEKASYYLYTLKPYNVSFVILNTGLWLKGYIDNSSDQQIKWLENILIDFKIKQKKLIIVGYDTPGSLENLSGLTKFDTIYNNRFLELLKNFTAAISFCIFGSDNIDSFRIVTAKDGTPLVPIFISPSKSKDKQSTMSSIRLFTFNINTFLLDNYVQFHSKYTNNNKVNLTSNYEFFYEKKKVDVKALYDYTKSFSVNTSQNFTHYYSYQLTNASFNTYCAKDHRQCVKCCSSCFILNLISSNVIQCLKQCSIDGKTRSTVQNSSGNNNAFFVLGVIIGFIVILLAIVVAVNKTYCIRRNRQRNIFLAPLTLDVHLGSHDNVSTTVKEIVIINSSKTMNGNHRRLSNHHELEQSYDYYRM